MKHLLFLFLLANPLFLFSTSWLTNFDQAQQLAKQEHKLILLNFSGSDWCGPCIKMKTEIFEKETFRKFAETQLLLVNADFPRQRKNRLSEEQQTHNELLAERYNKEGQFPLTLLLDDSGKVLKTWEGLPDFSADDFVKEIQTFIPSKKAETSKTYDRTLLLMGSRFSITVVAKDQEEGNRYIDLAIDEIKRIENLISSWNVNSQTTAINKLAGVEPLVVDQELFTLIERCKQISELTQGAFDISFGSIDKTIWHFDGKMTALPDSATAKAAVRLINYKNIILDKANSSVFLKEKGMRIGFGAIGKGYAAERAKAKLLEAGLASGIINAGGDLAVWGSQPDGSPWTVGIANPEQADHAFSWLEVNDQAVVTSGNYEKFVEIKGKRYSHIIDPRTGFPVSGLKSVTIICPNAELADALATSVFVLGVEVGIDLIDQLNGVECLIIDESNQLFASANINAKIPDAIQMTK